MYVSTTAPTPARRLVADISNPIFFVETAIIIPYPPETNNGNVLYLAFQPKVLFSYVTLCFSSVNLNEFVI
jgi:hypothetical protein